MQRISRHHQIGSTGRVCLLTPKPSRRTRVFSLICTTVLWTLQCLVGGRSSRSDYGMPHDTHNLPECHRMVTEWSHNGHRKIAERPQNGHRMYESRRARSSLTIPMFRSQEAAKVELSSCVGRPTSRAAKKGGPKRRPNERTIQHKIYSFTSLVLKSHQ